MSVSDFLSSIADKAQSAINQTPLAGHIPGTSTAGDSSANHPPSQGGHRSLALESLQHQIRNLGQQYTSTAPVQRIITLEKGVALNYDALGGDSKSQSKELYTWGQSQGPDLKDVTDRLAFLNFVHGSLSASLAVKLDNARASLKALRDAETALTPKRNIRAGLRNQIARIEHNAEKSGERRLAELKEQLARAERNDEHLEKELELLKRKAIRESEQRKWEAVREYGEKLVLLSQAANPIIGVLPGVPPATPNEYTGSEVTATARASLQHALDNYKPGQIEFRLRSDEELARSDTVSFGESHASELLSLGIPTGQDAHPGLRLTPPVPEHALNDKEEQGVEPAAQSVSVRSEEGPVQPVSVVAAAVVTEVDTASKPDERADDLYDTTVPKTESAEEEKKRLEREERERVQAAGNDIYTERAAVPETAEEEKKRLEREEKERVLAGAAEKDGDELPPYQDLQE